MPRIWPKSYGICWVMRGRCWMPPIRWSMSDTVESAKNYPVAINGKTRTELTIALDATQEQVEEIVLADEIVRKWLDGNPPKKIVYVKNRMINVVV